MIASKQILEVSAMFPDDDNFESMISLESEKGGVIEEKPFRMLILGDWSGDAQKKDFAARPFIEIDRDNFDSVMNRLQTKLDLDVSVDNEQFISLEFGELEDFHPDNLYRQVSLFADLRDLRRRLVNPDSFNSAAREVRNWIKADNAEIPETPAAEVKSVDSNELLDQILTGKSEPVKLQTEHSAELSYLLKDLVRPYLIDFDENEQKSLISIVDKATGNLMRKILHHPKFQKLESAWRSLSFLVKRAETDSHLKIYILDITKEEIANKLKEKNDLAESEVYRKLVLDAENKFDGDSFAAVFGNFDFHPNVEDVAALIRLSKIGKVIQSPFVSRVTEEILGIESLTAQPDYLDWSFSEDTNAGKLWTALRSLPESAFLGLTLNRFLTRLPYGAQTNEIDSFSFEEFETITPPHEKYVWGNTALLCALLLARSFSKHGWEMGNALEQDLEDLPAHVYSDGFETNTKPCGEIGLTQTACEKLMDYGVMPLISYRNSDKVKLARFQSVTKPVSALRGRWKL